MKRNLSHRGEFDALYPRRETEFETPCDSAELVFEFPLDKEDVFGIESDEQGKEVETDERASEADRGSVAQHNLYQTKSGQSVAIQRLRTCLQRSPGGIAHTHPLLA